MDFNGIFPVIKNYLCNDILKQYCRACKMKYIFLIFLCDYVWLCRLGRPTLTQSSSIMVDVFPLTSPFHFLSSFLSDHSEPFSGEGGWVLSFAVYSTVFPKGSVTDVTLRLEEGCLFLIFDCSSLLCFFLLIEVLQRRRCQVYGLRGVC